MEGGCCCFVTCAWWQKADNILLTKEGKVKLVDFGTSAMLNAKQEVGLFLLYVVFVLKKKIFVECSWNAVLDGARSN